MKKIGSLLRASKIDWWLFGAVVPIVVAGVVTMYSFTGDNSFATHQVIWLGLSIIVFFVLSFVDFHFLRSTWVSVSLFGVSTV
ncbi:MAG TPA: hypothetical protein VF438_03085, partial [Candidatus Paceibacterota bacterium]